jgi:hypothetical protein
MAREAGFVKEAQTTARSEDDAHRDDGAVAERSDGRFSVKLAFAKRGLDLASLSANELHELEESIWGRLSPVLDEIVERWQEEHGQLSEAERIDRELRRMIVAGRDRLDSDYECEGCSYRDRDGDSFVDFHGLFLCDGCTENARLALRGIQLPLIEALEADPTLERALALGFELTHRKAGGLVWVGDDDDYEGGSQPYADEKEALEVLAEELSY